MLTRRLSQADYNGLKAAFGELVEQFGTETAAARHTRLGQSDLSRFQSRNPEHLLRFAPIDVVADLEDASGVAVVTRHLAERAHCLLVPLPRGAALDAIDRHMIRSSREFAEMIAGIMAAKADGKITAAEAMPVLRDIRELMVELAGAAEAIQSAVQEDGDA